MINQQINQNCWLSLGKSGDQTNEGLSKDVIVTFSGNYYIGILKSWLKDGMLSPPQSVAKEWGILLERIL